MKKYIFILLTSFSLASCVDLLQEPQSKLTPATIELTEQTLESMTNGLYKDLWGENFGFNCRLASLALAGDDMTSGALDKVRNVLDDQLKVPIDNADVLNLWKYFYQTIYSANNIIYLINENENLDTQISNKYLGEAYFFRALSYFYIVRYWGDAPAITDPNSSTDIDGSSNMPRKPVKDIYERIILPDLSNAINLLPLQSRDNNNQAPDNKPEYSGHRTIRIQEFDVKTDKTIGPRKILVNKGAQPADKPIWIEGPHLYKINGKYFLMSAEGGTGNWHSEVIFRGDSPMGKFLPWKNNPILTQRHLNSDRPNSVTCAGHADLIQTKEGDWWAVFLACRPINNQFENLGRETFMMPVKWSEDGFPYMTQGDDLVPMIVKREGAKRDTIVTYGNFELIENFDSPVLDMPWMTLRASASDLYSLTETPGYLTLKCADISATEKKTPAFVCRRLQHHKFECATRMLFNPSNDKETAGMLLFKDEAHQYFFCLNKVGENKNISLKQIGEKEQTLASDEIDADTNEVYLKLVSQGIGYDFYYSIDGEKSWKLLCKDVDSSYLSTTTAGGFTGTTIGLYATCK